MGGTDDQNHISFRDYFPGAIQARYAVIVIMFSKLIPFLEKSSFFSDYSITRNVTIKSARLGFIHRGIQVFILVIVLTQILVYHTYARFEVPIGFYDNFPQGLGPSPPQLNSSSCATNYTLMDPYLQQNEIWNVSCVQADPSMFSFDSTSIGIFSSIAYYDVQDSVIAYKYAIGSEGALFGTSLSVYASFALPEEFPVHVYTSEGALYKTFDSSSIIMTAQEYLMLAGITYIYILESYNF
eukprot:TRINITY_DN15603_c0_g1::TRINITY_DN15603_c0_g1_i1::g.28455::m.28455 TRINITY_DN15603_c0_g1::TRINITY_DN15603_c0_g1_i1::g.28455  ORF type:complete len:240 (-),score=12.17,P2X_receptor/PF00864.14/0.062 TRINITY_DN15603_c0_g1_i1:121-840(-)